MKAKVFYRDANDASLRRTVRTVHNINGRSCCLLDGALVWLRRWRSKLAPVDHRRRVFIAVGTTELSSLFTGRAA